jgi:Na+/melibiose symporter-like transporter
VLKIENEKDEDMNMAVLLSLNTLIALLLPVLLIPLAANWDSESVAVKTSGVAVCILASVALLASSLMLWRLHSSSHRRRGLSYVLYIGVAVFIAETAIVPWALFEHKKAIDRSEMKVQEVEMEFKRALSLPSDNTVPRKE